MSKAIYHKEDHTHRIVNINGQWRYQQFRRHAELPDAWCNTGLPKNTQEEAMYLMLSHLPLKVQPVAA